MQDFNFSPLYADITEQDKQKFGSQLSLDITTLSSILLLLIAIALYAYISVALGFADASWFMSPALWLIGLGATLLCVYAGIRHNKKQWEYELRLKKFAATHSFTFTARAKRTDDVRSSPPKPAKKRFFQSRTEKYDQNIIHGTYAGRPFTIGTHVTNYIGGEGVTTKVAFLRIKLSKNTKSRFVLLGDGRAIERTELRNFTLQPKGLAPRFRVYLLHSTTPWQKIIPDDFQTAILQAKQPIDVEVENNFVTFYATNQLTLKSLPQLFQLVEKMW